MTFDSDIYRAAELSFARTNERLKECECELECELECERTGAPPPAGLEKRATNYIFLHFPPFSSSFAPGTAFLMHILTLATPGEGRHAVARLLHALTRP